VSHRLLTSTPRERGRRFGSPGARVLLAAFALSAAPGVRAAEGVESLAPVPLWETRSPVPGARVVEVEIADLDADGLPDLLLTGIGRDGPWWTAALGGAFGNVLWSRRHESRAVVRAAPTRDAGCRVAAVSGGRLDVLAGESGEALMSANIHGIAGGMDTGDVDGDGTDDIVCTSGLERDDVLVVFSGEDLRVLASARALPDGSRFGEGFGRPSARDSDGDGRCEIYVAENLDSLTRLDGEGGRAWTAALDERTAWFPKGAVTGDPEVADVTGDGVTDVSVGCLAGRLAVFDAATGETLVVRRFGARSGEDRRLARMSGAMKKAVASSGEPVNGILAVELDGRPGLDLVFGCSNGLVYAFAPARGEELWRFESGEKVIDRPLALDWSGDGRSDVLAWDHGFVHLLDGRTGEPLAGLPDVRDPDEVLLADLNGDGILDIVCVERGARRVAAWTTGVPVPDPAVGGVQ
jgi:hypothetical protein